MLKTKNPLYATFSQAGLFGVNVTPERGFLLADSARISVHVLSDGRGADTLNRYLLITSFLCLAGLFSTGTCLSADPSTQLSQAQKLATQGQLKAAKDILNRLISQHPRAPEAYNNLAAVEARQGNMDAAQALLEKALSTSPNHSLSYQNLNKINQSIALQAYKKSLALKAPKQTVQLTSANKFIQLSDSPKTQIKVVEKPVEVIKEVVREVEVERIVKVAADCPIAETTAEATKACSEPVDTQYPNPVDTVLGWAKAWSNKDVVNYINSYTRDYSHRKDKSHVDWVTLRRQRLSAPKFIRVNLKQLYAKRLSNKSASVQFLQHYQSDTINDSINKVLILVIEEGQWKIQQELSLL